MDPKELDELERLEREAKALGPWRWRSEEFDITNDDESQDIEFFGQNFAALGAYVLVLLNAAPRLLARVRELELHNKQHFENENFLGREIDRYRARITALEAQAKEDEVAIRTAFEARDAMAAHSALYKRLTARKREGECKHEWGIDGMHSNEYCKKCFAGKREGGENG